MSTNASASPGFSPHRTRRASLSQQPTYNPLVQWYLDEATARLQTYHDHDHITPKCQKAHPPDWQGLTPPMTPTTTSSSVYMDLVKPFLPRPPRRATRHSIERPISPSRSPSPASSTSSPRIEKSRSPRTLQRRHKMALRSCRSGPLWELPPQKRGRSVWMRQQS